MDKQTKKERLEYYLKCVRTEQSLLEITENSILNQLRVIKKEARRQERINHF